MTEPETAQAPAGTAQSFFVDPSFESSPGTPGTHTANGLPPSINRIRRNLGAEQGAPLRKLMVANRGVSIFQSSGYLCLTRTFFRRLPSESSVQPTSWLCPLSLSTALKIG